MNDAEKRQAIRFIHRDLERRFADFDTLTFALNDKSIIPLIGCKKLYNLIVPEHELFPEERITNVLGYGWDKILIAANDITFNDIESMYYAGIGSRETPVNILNWMTRLAERLSDRGFVLRSGAARGADSAFETGASHLESYLPWKGFNKSMSPYHTLSEEALLVACYLHPISRDLPKHKAAYKLMARNIHQVLGWNLSEPSRFVAAYTTDGVETARLRTKATGGTGQAIELADLLGIPVFNVKNKASIDRLYKMVLNDTRLAVQP